MRWALMISRGPLMKPATDDSATTVLTDEHYQTGIWRACDADRERVARLVQDAMARGMLTMIEAEERLAAAYAARFRYELEPITADLPIGKESAVGEQSVGWLARLDRRVHRLVAIIDPLPPNSRALVFGHRLPAMTLALLAVVVCVILLFFGAAAFVSD